MDNIAIVNSNDVWEETEEESQPLIQPLDITDSTKAETYAKHYANIYEKGPAGQALNSLGLVPNVSYVITPNENGGAHVDFEVGYLKKDTNPSPDSKQ